MDVLIITGGIGSGKSEACRILKEEFGCGVYYADERVKQMYDIHHTLLGDIEKLTGQSLRDSEGKFVPSRLSALIFTDSQLLDKVEQLVFPALMEDFASWAKAYENDAFVVLESATVLEKPYFKGLGDKVIVVDANMETRMERASVRDGVPHERISARMKNQKMMNSISNGEFNPDVDVIVYNTGTLTDLRNSIVSAVRNLYGKL